jgi:hypothetical protein
MHHHAMEKKIKIHKGQGGRERWWWWWWCRAFARSLLCKNVWFMHIYEELGCRVRTAWIRRMSGRHRPVAFKVSTRLDLFKL